MIAQISPHRRFDHRHIEAATHGRWQHLDFLQRSCWSNILLEVLDERHLALLRGVGSRRPAKQHGCLFNLTLVDRQLGESGQRRGILRLLEQMLAKQSLGIAKITRLKRGGDLLKNEFRPGCFRQRPWGLQHLRLARRDAAGLHLGGRNITILVGIQPVEIGERCSAMLDQADLLIAIAIHAGEHGLGIRSGG